MFESSTLEPLNSFFLGIFRLPTRQLGTENERIKVSLNLECNVVLERKG
jgi:hypothetical protein